MLLYVPSSRGDASFFVLQSLAQEAEVHKCTQKPFWSDGECEDDEEAELVYLDEE